MYIIIKVKIVFICQKCYKLQALVVESIQTDFFNRQYFEKKKSTFWKICLLYNLKSLYNKMFMKMYISILVKLKKKKTNFEVFKAYR